MSNSVRKRNQLAVTYLDHLDLGLETCRQLIQNFSDKVGVVQSLAHFHDSHDRCLYQNLAILFDVFVSRLLLYLQFCLKGEVDVDAKFFAEK